MQTKKPTACSDDTCAPAADAPYAPATNDSTVETKHQAVNSEILIEIISDLICPWCYVGKRRFESTLAQIDFADQIKVVWRPFQLNPNMPVEGINRRQYRTQKFGSWEHSQKLDAQIAAVGLDVGIPFNASIAEKTPNTFVGHRLVWYANQQGKQDEVVEALFKAYFCDGLDIGDIQTLVKLAVQVGLEEQCVRDFLLSNEGSKEVQAEEAMGRSLGVSGVPSFSLNGKLIFSGAQDPAIIVKHLKAAAMQTI